MWERYCRGVNAIVYVSSACDSILSLIAIGSSSTLLIRRLCQWLARS